MSDRSSSAYLLEDILCPNPVHGFHNLTSYVRYLDQQRLVCESLPPYISPLMTMFDNASYKVCIRFSNYWKL
uniref:Uncharacterized protein n=1 Tax=Oryza punctata TaxID=4537 RepID=A0A0E0MDH1_ORYPU